LSKLKTVLFAERANRSKTAALGVAWPSWPCWADTGKMPVPDFTVSFLDNSFVSFHRHQRSFSLVGDIGPIKLGTYHAQGETRHWVSRTTPGLNMMAEEDEFP
jgi:hypothetical protein